MDEYLNLIAARAVGGDRGAAFAIGSVLGDLLACYGVRPADDGAMEAGHVAQPAILPMPSRRDQQPCEAVA
jgi:hypothetical protein